MGWRNLTDAASHSGGVVATARWQGCTEQLEKPSSPHREIDGARSRITEDTGKSAEGERVAEGPVVARKRVMTVEQRGPAVCNDSVKREGRGEMTKAPISLQDLRRRIYVKAKAEPTWRFWGLYVHVGKMETLQEAYQMAKRNDGAPGIDGVTFDAIGESGVERFLMQIRDELVSKTYRPMRSRKKEIPKDGGKVRILSIPAIRDRVVQGALKLILEPIFEADFQSGSYGYRPKRTAHEAIDRVAKAIVEDKTRIIDLDLKAYFDNVQHSLLLEKVARRIQDGEIMHLLKMILATNGKKGVPQGGVISPVLSNLYLTEVDRMLEKAIATTRYGKYSAVQYVRFADDMVILIDAHPRHDWLVKAVGRRLREELAKLRVEINEDKSRMVDLKKGGSFAFLGFEYRRVRSLNKKWRPQYAPKLKKRTALFAKLREVFRRSVSQPVGRVIEEINPILRGWVNYFRVGHSNRCFAMIKHWVEKKIRRQMMRSRGRKGMGWKRWSREWIYGTLGLFSDYRVGRDRLPKARPA
jgi:RNA-directed DNA polymerase